MPEINESTKISLSLMHWVGIVTTIISLTVSLVGGYYYLNGQITLAANSPASPVEYQLKDEFVRSEVQRLADENKELQIKNEDQEEKIQLLEQRVLVLETKLEN